MALYRRLSVCFLCRLRTSSTKMSKFVAASSIFACQKFQHKNQGRMTNPLQMGFVVKNSKKKKVSLTTGRQPGSLFVCASFLKVLKDSGPCGVTGRTYWFKFFGVYGPQHAFIVSNCRLICMFTVCTLYRGSPLSHVFLLENSLSSAIFAHPVWHGAFRNQYFGACLACFDIFSKKIAN